MAIAVKDDFLKSINQLIHCILKNRFHLKKHILPSREERYGSKAHFSRIKYFHLEEIRTSSLESKLHQCNLSKVTLENY